jgi:formate dehydrogenase major subunit
MARFLLYPVLPFPSELAMPPIWSRWPLLRQIADGDLKGFGDAARSPRTEALRPRTERADRVVRSVCPYCAVGCGQLVSVEAERISSIEGDPDSPVSHGCLCPKGAATFQLVTGDHRVNTVLHRRPGGNEWEEMPLEAAMDRVAALVKEARDEDWEEALDDGTPVRRLMTVAHLGGATLDNEENYLLKKLFTAGLGMTRLSNQARI